MLLMPTRRQVLAGALGAGLLAATGAHGVEAARGLAVTAYRPDPPAWPPGLRLRIAALADFHVGDPYMSLARVEAIVAATNALSPDLILLLGDYPAGRLPLVRPVPMPAFAREVERLRAPLGVHAILGNHDWWDDEEALRARRGPVEAQRALEARGIGVLENRALRLSTEGGAFWLAGLGDQIPFVLYGDRRGLDDLPGTLAQVTDGAPVILLAHEPHIFPRVPARVALTLSGHTHGGQVRLMGVSPLLLAEFGGRYAYGHVVEDGRHMIVSGGLGCSRLPVRFGVPPEIVLIELGSPGAPA